MKCKVCGKDITSLNYFTKKEYCSKECESKYVPTGDIKDLFETLFKTK